MEQEIKCKICEFVNPVKKKKRNTITGKNEEVIEEVKCEHELMDHSDVALYWREDNYTAPPDCPLLREQWRVSNINIDFCEYGTMKGKYKGKIKFKNGLDEEFSFVIYPGMANQYIKLIAEELVKGAENLGKRLILSLGLKPKSES